MRTHLSTTLIFLAGAALGAAVWFAPDLFPAPNRVQSIQLSYVALGFPLLLLIGLYELYQVVRHWHGVRRFEREKQRTRGVVTHLWRDKDATGRWVHYAGYAFGDGHHVYEDVNKRRFNSLSIGREVWASYLPSDPDQVMFELGRVSRKRKPSDGASAPDL